VRGKKAAVLLDFGFVFASAFAKATARQAVTGRIGHAPSLKPRQNTKIPENRVSQGKTLKRKIPTATGEDLLIILIAGDLFYIHVKVKEEVITDSAVDGLLGDIIFRRTAQRRRG